MLFQYSKTKHIYRRIHLVTSLQPFKIKNMKKVFIPIFASLFSVILISCGNSNNKKSTTNFDVPETLSLFSEFSINEDSLGKVEGIFCSDNYLIVFGQYEEFLYSLFDCSSGQFINRFAQIGQGPNEIPFGSQGYPTGKYFYIFNDQTKQIYYINLDSLSRGNDSKLLKRLTKYNIPEAQFSKLAITSDSTYIGVGDYQSGNLYTLFNNRNNVLDSNIKSYNAEDNAFNNYTRFISNQGCLTVHPNKDKFAFSPFFSSNIDFVKITDNKISPINLLRLENPKYDALTEGNGTVFRAIPSKEAITGYIDLCCTSEYVYALHSSKKLYENWRKSTDILVYDWKGNPIKKYTLDKEAYHIAVNERLKRIYVTIENENGDWDIVCYKLT